jgi:hypothetical protein
MFPVRAVLLTLCLLGLTACCAHLHQLVPYQARKFGPKRTIGETGRRFLKSRARSAAREIHYEPPDGSD